MKSSPRVRRSGATALALGMLLLIVAQLVWWLIFFRRNQAETAALHQQLDRLRVAAANGELNNEGKQRPGSRALEAYRQHSESQAALTVLPDGRYAIAAEELAAREAESQRAFFMLLSESVFVIILCAYGTLRVIRTIRRERRLAHDRQIFMDSVTHELKTPLASILLNLQTMQKRQLGREQELELLQDSVEDVRRLAEQLNNILLSGRLTRGTGDETGHTNTSVPVKQCIEAYLRENEKRFEKVGLRCELHVPAELAVRLPREALQTIVSNLVQNSIQYAGDRPAHLQIRAEYTHNKTV